MGKKGFVIDTNVYTGGFERQLCAFVTGHIGDCKVGKKEADIYLETHEPIRNVLQVENENGVARPVEIYPTPEVWNNGLGFSYKDGEEALAIQEYQRFRREYNEKNVERAESHRGKNVPSWTDEAIDREIFRLRNEVAKTLTMTTPPKYEAYHSVMIHFSLEPTIVEIQFIKERAFEFSKGNKFKIEGFRLIGFGDRDKEE